MIGPVSDRHAPKDRFPSVIHLGLKSAFLKLVILSSSAAVWGAVTGSISGTLRDQTGAVIPGATLTITNTAQGTRTRTTTDTKGFYSLPSLAVGRYDLQVEAGGFRLERRTGLVIDADSALTVDLKLEMAEKIESVTVESEAAVVEVSSTQMGQVVKSTQITAVALNGRSYTDLLALQPGIVPTTTQQPE